MLESRGRDQRWSASDLASLKASGADIESLGGAIDGGANPLDVGIETALGDLA